MSRQRQVERRRDGGGEPGTRVMVAVPVVAQQQRMRAYREELERVSRNSWTIFARMRFDEIWKSAAPVQSS